MRNDMMFYPQLDVHNSMKTKLANMRGEFYAVESEHSGKTTYIEREGEFAIVYGRQAVVMKEELWEELCDVLLDLRYRKRLGLTNRGLK